MKNKTCFICCLFLSLANLYGEDKAKVVELLSSLGLENRKEYNGLALEASGIWSYSTIDSAGNDRLVNYVNLKSTSLLSRDKRLLFESDSYLMRAGDDFHEYKIKTVIKDEKWTEYTYMQKMSGKNIGIG